MTLPNVKCGTEQCPLNSVLDGLREQVELQMKVNAMVWDNLKRRADMVTMRGCPADACTLARRGKA